MLSITVPERELFDEETGTFSYTKETHLVLEHSLVSLSKWESKWHKPFLKDDDKSSEEIIDYIRCMTITQNVNPDVYYALTPEIIRKVNDYISDPMTATTFSEQGNNRKSKEIITAELIYYWMISLNIPVEFQKWHLNRLLTLIRVCNIKNTPPKKMSKGEIMSRNKALNASRRNAMHSKG